MKEKPEVREQILDEFESSGMNGRAFAKHHGIKELTFATESHPDADFLVHTQQQRVM